MTVTSQSITNALAYPDGLKRIRPARVIRTESRAATEPIVFTLDVGAYRQQIAEYMRGRP